jgi:Flp pilus assembly protein CpaB
VLGQRPKSRLVNLRVLVLLALSTIVFFGIFAVTGANRSAYEVLVASGYLAPGQKFTELAFTRALVQGDPLTSSRGEVFLTPETVSQYYGRIVVNGIYPGDPIRVSDFYRPACDEGLTAAAPTPSPDPSAAPTDQPEADFVYRLTELLCEGRRVVVIEGDPTSTFVRAGDIVDLYLVADGGESGTQVTRLFTKRVVYVITRSIPVAGDPATDEFNPRGTAFVLDLTPDEVAILLGAQADGSIRVAIAPPGALDETVVPVEPGVSPTPFPTPSPSVPGLPSPAVPTPAPSPSGGLIFP